MSHPPALSLFPTPSFSRPLPRLRTTGQGFDEPLPRLRTTGQGFDEPLPRLRTTGQGFDEPQPLRSMFPVYDPNLPLDRQDYYPPADVVQARPEPSEIGVSVTRRLPTRMPSQPETDCQLKGLWKAANGWRAPESEGRVYCLAMSRPRDAPVYSFSSASEQPFYRLRLDPTSASANVSLTRHDPASKGSKGWQDAVSTTLEVESSDGLVARLMPSAAARMALDRPDDAVLMVAADNECARLVWDDDSASHFLVHPALAHPFSVAVERSPAYSRTHYTLEHHECPGFLARLTRNGTGAGWLEVNTSVAAKTGAYYMVDVAVAALAIVAANDDRNSPAPAETFEPPPPLLPPPRAVLADGGSRRPSRFSRLSFRRKDRQKKAEQFELDVDSHDGSLGKGTCREEAVDEKQRSFATRAVVKVSKAVGKCAFCVMKMLVKLVAAIFRLAYKCVR
ncbi:hypothetical protein L249_0661 [Ophiocordyceps polyrhachis-furcata BCC 54312]|uniref:Acetylserotonin methytransferase-like protein n=1 Tax=Ophiocordyceps polyrhachis-furcata BCC 54312 TaxID=1330021 RepID=A0A367LE47_9HYPO|nr:hypothetical protein L249_0661 [Ophiocordyceps polyrhachis-furcata BCC 54312]